MAQRAIATEHKQARRTAILDAAKELFMASDGRLPTSAEVASATGLAKGTIYLYFRSKEEIFATLLLEGWIPVMGTAPKVFGEQRGKRADKVKAFISGLVSHLERHPELLRLDALGAGVLEKNMTAAALHNFKHEFAGHLLKAGSSIDSALHLAQGRGVQILMRTYALTRGLWQSAQHDEKTLAADMASGLFLTRDTFLQELTEALTEYWRGALT